MKSDGLAASGSHAANFLTRTRDAANGSYLHIHLTDPAHYGIMLLRATGSATHLEQLEALAARKRFTLDATGLRCGRKIIARSEEEIYAALGLHFIEPELREGTDEIALGLKHALPKLVTDHDLRGGVPAERVINALTFSSLLQHLQRRSSIQARAA